MDNHRPAVENFARDTSASSASFDSDRRCDEQQRSRLSRSRLVRGGAIGDVKGDTRKGGSVFCHAGRSVEDVPEVGVMLPCSTTAMTMSERPSRSGPRNNR